jgi:hypothetical protein
LRRDIQLNDLPAWDRLHAGEFVVFLSNARSDVGLDRGDVPVFDNLPEAEAYAEQAVSGNASVCAAIYDHHGRSGDPVHRVYHASVQHTFDPERRARRLTWTGGGFLLAFAIWAVYAATSTEEHFLWFYIAGVKLLTLGTVLFVQGIGYYLGRRK